MSDLVAILLAWALVIGGLGAYGLWTITRGKALAKLVPEDRQRWMTTETTNTETGKGESA